MLEELKKLLKHSTIYGAGNVLGKVVGFFMIPFYTHYLTPADYGTLELLDLSLTLITIVLTMWLNASIVRHYNDFEDPKQRNQSISTTFIFSVFIGVVVAGLGLRFSRPLSALILNTPDLHFFVALEAVSFLVSAVNVVCLSYLRARQRSSLVVTAGLVSMFLSLLLNIYFIAFRHTGVVGVLYSSLISSTLVTVVLSVHMVRQVKLSFSYSKLKGIVAFGAPLIVTSAAAFTVNFSDRFFLRHFSTISTVGVYALGYKFGFMLSLLVVQPFDMIWQARIYEIAKQPKSGETFSRLFEYYCFVLVTAALGLSIVIKELLAVISAPAFHDAYKVVAVVALAYVFQGMNRFFLAGTYIAKKTIRLGPVGLASAGANIGLNLLLIPRYGMLGAAWATAISFFFMSLLALFVSQRVYRIPYVFSRVVLMLGLATLVYLASGLVVLPSSVLQVSTKLALFAAFPVALYLLGFFEKQEIAKGRALAQTFLHRYRPLTVTEPGR
jgi:O-antigen/teichoic acid export membrane protein